MSKAKCSPLLIGIVIFSFLVNSACAVYSHQFDNIEEFAEIPVDFQHQWDGSSHPFSGAAVIDINGDGRMEVFIGGGQGQDDALLRYQNQQLINIIEGTGLSSSSATYGSASIDIDNDGDVDLLVARNNGLYLYVNQQGVFTPQKIPLDLARNAVPFSIALSDIDHDGDADLYISVFVDPAMFRSGVFNDPEHAKKNVLLVNNGDLTFTDITVSSNTAGKQNTFLSVFTDLNNDGWQDLVLAQNTGQVEIFRNDKDKTFSSIPNPSGFGFWMGLAIGDIDKDGDQDLFFSNIGDSIPTFITSGDIADNQRHTHEWLLLRNDGEFQFSDVTDAYGLSGEGFAWGAVFEDLNLDGQLDLLVAQNYIKWPIHKLFKLPARSYLQTAGGDSMQHVPELGLENSYYGQSPLMVDLNNDLKPDVLWLNMDGPVRAFLNRTSANYVAVEITDNAQWLGTRFFVETLSGRSYSREVVTSTGMLTDQSPNIVFGLGKTEKVKRVIINYPDGSIQTINSPSINSVISVQELTIK